MSFLRGWNILLLLPLLLLYILSCTLISRQMMSGFLFTFWILYVSISTKPGNTQGRELNLMLRKILQVHPENNQTNNNTTNKISKTNTTIQILKQSSSLKQKILFPGILLAWKVYLLQMLKCRKEKGNSLSSSHPQ